MREHSKASVCSAYTTGNHEKQIAFPYPIGRAVVTSFAHTKLNTSLLILKTCISERNSILLFNYGQFLDVTIAAINRNDCVYK